MFKIKEIVGYLVVSYNDLALSEKMYPSLVTSIPANTPWGIQVVDGGSTDGSLKFWSSKSSIIGPNNEYREMFYKNRKDEDYRSLAVCLNDGISAFMRNPQINYICHIHPDMEFPEEGWTNKMVEHMQKNQDVAKLGVRIMGADDGAGEGPGNQCPWMIHRSTIEKLLEKDGHVFDEKYIGIGGYEDWDLARRLVSMGQRVWITNDTRVKHIGAGTRFGPGRNTNPEMHHNAMYYQQKWGTNKPVV